MEVIVEILLYIEFLLLEFITPFITLLKHNSVEIKEVMD